MKCGECNGPVGAWFQFEYSKTAKTIEKIKKGIKCPNFDEICSSLILPSGTSGTLCRNDSELAFHTGFEMAILECGELLAKAQDDDK